jgi:patatin-like phospholipase/acyl hydrolase
MAKYVLSCDGGGIRGAASARFLELLEEHTGKKIQDIFDLFAGTSTGAIIAVGISVAEMSGSTLSELYNYDNSNTIMDKSIWDRYLRLKLEEPKYDGKGKRKTLEKYFGDRLLKESRKPTLVVTYDIEARKSAVLKSTDNNQIKAVEAVDASSAAPLYFPPVRVGNRYLIDGGVIANNPAMCAYAEAIKLWPEEKIKLLSLGTGKLIRKIDGEEAMGYGALGWVNHDLLGIVMDETVVEYQAKTILGKNYLRINSNLDDVNDDMDDCSRQNIEALKQFGERWFEANKAALSTFFD